ncbi:MAG: CHAP domain-containing protein [Thermoflexales bacterium]|nr:CHAP domain-containing protein [Thermoflexales bacterium]
MKIRVPATLIIVLVMVLVLDLAVAVQDAAASRRYQQEEPPSQYRVLSGNEWLGGLGVNVYYRYKSPCQFVTGCPMTLKPLNTCAYQCVDLAVRLYNARLGYGQWRLNGRVISTAAEMAEVARRRPEGFQDLEFYENGKSSTPPRPGDLIVWPASYNGGVGHVAVVHRMQGSTLTVVQQNMCSGAQAIVQGTLSIAEDSNGRFHLTANWDGSRPYGWIRSPRMVSLLRQEKLLKVGSGENHISWNRDGDTVYVYLSPAYTERLARERDAYSSQTANEIIGLLNQAKALVFTDSAYARCILAFVAGQIRTDQRFNLAKGVRSVDFTIKYTGSRIWIRPWGGEQSGKWIALRMPGLCQGTR